MPDTISLAAPDGSLAEVIVYADLSTLIDGAAGLVEESAAEAIAARGSFNVALSGGNTPRPVYQRLATATIDWTRVHVFFGDERCVPPRDARSNYHMARAALLDHVAIPPENVHRMRGEDPPDAAAEAYAVELRNALGEGGRLDLVLLGLGHDAHTASLFPGLAAVTETRRAVMEAYVEFVGMWRLTLTPPTINAARRVVFLVSGDDKADVLHRVLQGPRQPIVLPAQAIRPSERPALWLIDAAAAAKLDRRSARYAGAGAAPTWNETVIEGAGPAGNSSPLDVEREERRRHGVVRHEPRLVHHQPRHPQRSLLPESRSGLHSRPRPDRHRRRELLRRGEARLRRGQWSRSRTAFPLSC